MSSITYVYDESGNILVKMYLEFGGYPTSHGLALSKFLNSYFEKQGHLKMEKLSANLVCNFLKKQPGYAMLISPFDKTTYCEWEYHIYSGIVKISYLNKEYEANWMNKDFENICLKGVF